VRAVLDACVLYPPSLRDFLLTLASLDAFEVRWSEEILREVERNVIADYPDVDPQQFRRHTIGSMNTAFGGALTELPSTPTLFEGVDDKDQHVANCALASESDTIITVNLRDFPSAALTPRGIKVLSSGQLIVKINDEDPELIDAALQSMSKRWRNPPRTPLEILQMLSVHPTMQDAAATVANRFRSDED
jgi:predicted nucleic acid-binding protein